jgi:copper(I)-binding protein
MPVHTNILVVAALLFLSTGLCAESELSWSDAYANALIPGQEVSAGYLTITNNGDQDERLVGFDSEAAEMVQLHESSMSNGMMSMKHIESMVIPAGESVQLQPGGLHLMIMGADKEAFAGESIEVDLHFSSGGMLTTTLPIKNMMHSGQ